MASSLTRRSVTAGVLALAAAALFACARPSEEARDCRRTAQHECEAVQRSGELQVPLEDCVRGKVTWCEEGL
jgi:hypothetical protein